MIVAAIEMAEIVQAAYGRAIALPFCRFVLNCNVSVRRMHEAIE